MTRGHIRKRTANSYEIKLDLGRDEATGKRLITYHSVKGTAADAERKRTELLAALDKGSYVKPHKLIIGDYIAARIDHWHASGTISAAAAQRYGNLCTHQIRPHLGAHLLQKLKPIHVENWHTTLLTSGRRDKAGGGLAPATVGKAHDILQKALEDAHRHELVSRNVAALQPPPSRAAREVQILTEAEIGDLLAKLTGTALYIRAVVLLFTGLRRGELLALTWKHIDFDNGKILVRQALEETKANGVRVKPTKTKNGARDVPMPDIVIEVLRAHRREHLEQRVACGLGRLTDNDLVFPNRDGRFQAPRRVSAQWCVTVRRLGFKHIKLHALRHTYASMLIANDVDIAEVSKQMGHGSPSVTLSIYTHLFKRRKDKSAAAINAVVNAILTRPSARDSA